ncbi:MAG: preprotein translocase subunit SecA [Firmicutes bacterium]|nr:preprotein translocase subunit SecA [Bacillota bacterium]
MPDIFKKNSKDTGKSIQYLNQIVLETGNLLEFYSKLSDKELKEKSFNLKKAAEEGKELEELIFDAFALVREASWRTIGLRHFNVQIMGGAVLHGAAIAEMKTGEGKTLTAVLPAYLNALKGKGVHVVTVNDYLAKRDFEWMGPVYQFLGLTAGVIQENMDLSQRRSAYRADVTYVTNKELGFDFLKDKLITDVNDRLIRSFDYAIIDEIDSVLIDEARTPLIISSSQGESPQVFHAFKKIADKLVAEKDYCVDNKYKVVYLTEEGIRRAEKFLGISNLYSTPHMGKAHLLLSAVKAKELYQSDVDYIVRGDEVIIVDEFTGRLLFGRRYSDGLQFAIEAKEGVSVQPEGKTLASITFQNFFRSYRKICGMTGTALPAGTEFKEIYSLEVIEIPTNKPVIRNDCALKLFRSKKDKFAAAIEEIKKVHQSGRPVLVGTRSIEDSNHISLLLRKAEIDHNVLNAKNHEMEASIIAQAGRKGSVTVATNMAGRGVDIMLGGMPFDAGKAKEIAAIGGLHVIGTECHESRRIDDQLSGRAGRQGDPGSSVFFLSAEDELLTLYNRDKIEKIAKKIKGSESLAGSRTTKAVHEAQLMVENYHFTIRKNLLFYDDVLNAQRKIIYGERDKILEGSDWRAEILRMIEDFIDREMELFNDNISGLIKYLSTVFKIPENAYAENFLTLNRLELKKNILRWAVRAYLYREYNYSKPTMRQLERLLLLRVIDRAWIDHIMTMEALRDGIGLRAYGHWDPKVEYIREAAAAFDEMKKNITDEAVNAVFKVKIVVPQIKNSSGQESSDQAGSEGI